MNDRLRPGADPIARFCRWVGSRLTSSRSLPFGFAGGVAPQRVNHLAHADQDRIRDTHGHTFKVLRADRRGRPIQYADTVLVTPEETVEIAFVADNPGRWMMHCRVIEHQDGRVTVTPRRSHLTSRFRLRPRGHCMT